jgi:myo-inositol-1(or 4)-monophosphatase
MSKEFKVLKQCLSSAGKILKKHFNKTSYTLKGRANLLTKADLESQREILKIIKGNFPTHAYLAEENANKKSRSDFLWVIDPIDGTTNYAHGFPAACISVALLKNGTSFLGGIYDPFRNEMFTAQKGKGSFLNGKRIRVSKTQKLSRSLLFTGFPYDRAKRPMYYCKFYIDFLKVSHGVRRSGSAALDMAWVACGRVDGFWELKLNPWDVSAGKLLVEEAGGKVTDFHNKPWKDIANYGKQTLATNSKIHTQMSKIVKRNL